MSWYKYKSCVSYDQYTPCVVLRRTPERSQNVATSIPLCYKLPRHHAQFQHVFQNVRHTLRVRGGTKKSKQPKTFCAKTLTGPGKNICSSVRKNVPFCSKTDSEITPSKFESSGPLFWTLPCLVMCAFQTVGTAREKKQCNWDACQCSQTCRIQIWLFLKLFTIWNSESLIHLEKPYKKAVWSNQMVQIIQNCAGDTVTRYLHNFYILHACKEKLLTDNATWKHQYSLQNACLWL